MRLISGCLVIGAAASLSAPSELRAQTVAQGVRSDSSGTVVGALVGLDAQQVPYGTVLIIETGEARFTDSHGQFRFARLVPGTYKLRARQIGYAPVDTTVQIDPAPAVTAVTIRMTRLPPLLGLVRVEGRRPDGCEATGVPDSAANAGLAAIFAQIRENVDRYRILWNEYPQRYTREKSVRLLQNPGRDSTLLVQTGTYQTPFERPYGVGVVAQNEVDSSGRTTIMIYAPTFRDLADTTFLLAHCFTYGGEEQLDAKSGDRVFRVDFQPATAITAPDVEGSLFLDADRLVVRRAVFRLTKPAVVRRASLTITSTYRELMPLVPVLEETRTVQVPAPTGGREGVVASRSIVTEDRFSHYTFENRTPGDQPALTPAEVAALARADGKATATHRVVAVEGRVVRADGILVHGAVVGLLASKDSATSDSGRFVIRNVTPGAHILWVHGVGIKPTRVAISVSAASPPPLTITVARAVPVLAPIVTKARYPAGYVDVGLDKRIDAGLGSIITFDQIEHRHAVKVSQLLQNVRGIHLHFYYDPDARIMSTQGGCVAFMLDGVSQKSLTSHDLDNLVSPDQIGAIEIYSPAEAPAGWGGVTPGPQEETLKGQATPAGIQISIVAGNSSSGSSGAGTQGTAAPQPVSQVTAALPEPCAVMAIWTVARLRLSQADTAAPPDSGYRATASRATETSGTAVFPPVGVPACEPPAPTDATTLDVYAEIRDAMQPSARDSAWRSYSSAVLGAIRDAFAFPSELELPVFGYANPARPTAKNLRPRGLVVSPSLSGVISFTLSPTGELIESHVAASSLSADADTSILAAVQGAAAANAFPAMPATGQALSLQSAHFDLMVTTTTPDAGERAVIVDQIDVPVWPLSRPAALSPGKQPDLQSLRAAGGAKPDSAVFELVVDESGKAIMPTVRAISETAAGAADPSYRGFVTQVAGLLPKFEFEPARVGACPVRQIMLQPLTD